MRIFWLCLGVFWLIFSVVALFTDGFASVQAAADLGCALGSLALYEIAELRSS